MARHLAVETAYARNIADPLVLTIDGTDFRFDPRLDVARLAALFTRFQEGLTNLGDESLPLGERVGVAEAKRAEGIEALTTCVVDEQRQQFATEAAMRLDVTALANVVTWLLQEVSGQTTPTQPPSSSDGSSGTGAPSTAGAAPEASTSPVSPSTVP